jgi:hypothetical protein
MERNDEIHDLAPLNMKKVAVGISLIIVLIYFFWLGFALPNDIREKLITVELIEKTDRGYSIIAQVSGICDPVKINLNLDRHGVNDVLEMDKQYMVIFRTGFLPYHWAVLKIEPYKGQWWN